MHRRRMYLDYKYELCAMDGIDGLRADEEDYLNDVHLFLHHPEAFEWIPIMDGDEEVGFMIMTDMKVMASKGKDSIFGEDYRIEETYVMPEHRNKGLASKVVKKFFAEHPGKYSMQLMINNLDAADFWFHLIGKKFSGKKVLNAKAQTMDLMFTIKEGQYEA